MLKARFESSLVTLWETIRRVVRTPLLLWTFIACGLLALCTWTVNTDAFFLAACELDNGQDGPPIHESMLTLMILGLSWLVLAYHRGIRLRSEIEHRKAAEARALALAREDPLTGLLNRRAFVEEMEGAIARGEDFIVLVVDLDDFKGMNDAHGHAAGDATLQSVAQRLTAGIGPGSVAARLGGDEFAALVRPNGPAAPPRAIAAVLAEHLQWQVPWRGIMARAGASLGAAEHPADGASAEALMHAADLAMYCAKGMGGGKLRFFAPSMEAERNETRLRDGELRRGIACGEIVPYYQPMIRLADEAICGFEILARWLHPRLGLLPPSEFIALAEATGQITDLTENLLRQACRDVGSLPGALRFALNVSPAQLAEPRFAERLVDIVHAAGVSPTRVEIELTEDSLMGDSVRAASVIAIFRASGMTVALDDFGTGYSGLSTLRKLKFDKLKIDRSFVGTMLDSEESRKLVEAILDLGRSFDLAVTAEGIESEAVLAALAAKGCAQGQGYLFGKPMPFEAAAELVRLNVRSAA